jgi:hypothetical protein
MKNEKELIIDVVELQQKALKRIENTKDVFSDTKSIKSTIELKTKTNDDVKITSECVVSDFVGSETKTEIENIKVSVEKFLIKNMVIGLVRKANKTILVNNYKDFTI